MNKTKNNNANASESSFIEEAIHIRRTTKVVKGGRQFGFSALAVVGDGNGRVGYGLGKSKEVPVAIKKAIEEAKRNMNASKIRIPLSKDGSTIAYPIKYRACRSKIMILPAAEGRGIIAGDVMRAVFTCLGLKNVVAKSLGSRNPINVVKATIEGLQNMKPVKYIADQRGKTVKELFE
jgi:small subunit ribosomal protein S5